MKTVRKTLREVVHRFGFDVIRYQDPNRAYPPDFDEDVIDTIRAVREYTMTSSTRLFALCEAVKYVVNNQIPGDIVECGVWRGGSMMAVARTLLKLNDRTRDLHLFDTFEGMTPPTEKDKDANGVAASLTFGDEPSAERKASLPWRPEPVEGVRRAVLSTGIAEQKCHFVKGRVEDTLPDYAPQKICLLRLDTDWYESTKHEMIHLFPRIAAGGVIIIDDYGYWQGARQAVDEYLQANQIRLLLNRIDETGRIGIVRG